MKRLPKSSIIYVITLLSAPLLAEELKWASYVEGGFITYEEGDGSQSPQEEKSSTPSTTTALSWGGNRYEFRLLGRIENTWSYQVISKAGQELNHWTLGIEGCKEQMLTFTAGGQMGQDKSINDRYFGGLQWAWVPKGRNVFSFTLREDYPTKTVEVLAKAGNNYSTGLIAGPACPEDNIIDESVCTLAYKKKLETAWYNPQWLKTKARLILSRKNAQNKWVAGGKVKVFTGSHVVHPNENDSNDKLLLLGKPVPCPMENPNCGQGEVSSYPPTSGQTLVSNPNGIVEFEVVGWWPGVPKNYRNATKMTSKEGKPDWQNRARYLVQTYYEGIVLGEKDKKLGSFHQLVEWDATMGMCQPYVLSHPPATDFWEGGAP